MSIASAAPGQVAQDNRLEESKHLNFITQVFIMTWRAIKVTFRSPAEIIPGLIIGVFFLFVYESSLGGAANFFLPGESYLGFILPLSVISSALSGAGVAGQLVVRDISTGYFDKLLLTPISRGALLLGPMIAGALVIVLQAGVIVVTALFMGLEPETGVLGLLTVLGYALFIGIALAGIIVGIALRTNSAAATGSASFLFFPLTFLTASFTPLELLSGWLRTAAEYNPITYLLEATRSLLNTGWESEILLRAFIICLVICVISFVWAIISLRARTKRR
jgi:ABC-2 type transport system permease protein